MKGRKELIKKLAYTTLGTAMIGGTMLGGGLIIKNVYEAEEQFKQDLDKETLLLENKILLDIAEEKEIALSNNVTVSFSQINFSAGELHVGQPEAPFVEYYGVIEDEGLDKDHYFSATYKLSQDVYNFFLKFNDKNLLESFERKNYISFVKQLRQEMSLKEIKVTEFFSESLFDKTNLTLLNSVMEQRNYQEIPDFKYRVKEHTFTNSLMPLYQELTKHEDENGETYATLNIDFLELQKNRWHFANLPLNKKYLLESLYFRKEQFTLKLDNLDQLTDQQIVEQLLQTIKTEPEKVETNTIYMVKSTTLEDGVHYVSPTEPAIASSKRTGSFSPTR